DHRTLGGQRGHEIAMHRTEGLDEHIDLAAAAQADRPGEVVAHAVVKEAGRFPAEDRLRLFENLAFETAAADRSCDLPRPADGHPGSGGPRRTPPGADHRRDRHRVALLEPRLDVGHDVAHNSKCSALSFPSPAVGAGPT